MPTSILAPLLGIFLLTCYHWIFLRYFPAANGHLGHDYSYYLPSLLDGYYWYLSNGAFTPQWFSAAFCGGVPTFANPLNLYYSVPQWLTFVIDPLTAVYLTLLMFAALGLWGFYLLLRWRFHTSQATALLGAALFLFNGFFVHRLLVGHLGFHAFMLLPLITFFLLRQPQRITGAFFHVSLAALLLSYMIYSGMVHLIVPVILALLFIGILHGIMQGGARAFWLKLLAAGAMSLAISMPKLAAAVAFLGHFPRSAYQLPGAESVWGLVRLTFESLFLQPSAATIQQVMTNVQWALERHELEYGVTLVPLCLLVLAILGAIRYRLRQTPRCRPPLPWLALTGLALIWIIPLALNYYHPAWNALLKATPILRNSSNLLRWFSLYIPSLILTAVLSVEKTTALAPVRPYISAIGIVAVVLIGATANRDFYQHPPYSPEHIMQGYAQANERGAPPNITEVVVFRDKQGRLQLPHYRNDTLVQGGSQLLCYEPIFGYRLEALPIKPLHPGRVDSTENGLLNLKNPACYVYPEANKCQPGDHFTAGQRQEMEALVTYKPFRFEMPIWQQAANLLSVGVLSLMALFWVAYPLSVYYQHGKSVNQKT